jgi:hypothetical protein
MGIPRNIPLPSARLTGTILAVVLAPLALEAGYLLYLKRSVSRRSVATAGLRLPAGKLSASGSDAREPPTNTIPSSVKRPATMPAEVSDDASDYALAFERVVSHPVPASSLKDTLSLPSPAQAGRPTQLMTTYLRTTMKAFTWTPQAFFLRSAVGPDAKATFDADFLDALEFEVGDRVDGVYTVSYRGARSGEPEERVEMMLDPPESYHGPVVQGMIISGIELLPGDGEEATQAVFINETWLWRRLEDKPTLLEGAVGRWLHSLLAQWLVVKGLKAVSR